MKGHLKGEIANGLTADQLKEVMIHAANYAGWPSAMNGLMVLQEVADEMGLVFSVEE